MAKRAEKQLEILGPNEVALAEHAAVIRVLGKRVVRDVIEIGQRLVQCKEIAGHGGWLPWLEREFEWSEDTAERYMAVAKLGEKFRTVRNLDVPLKGLYLLAAPSTPEEAREAVIERAQLSAPEMPLVDDTAEWRLVLSLLEPASMLTARVIAGIRNGGRFP
jgi:hypothetical protein